MSHATDSCVVVTGGCGFIGSHLVGALRAAGARRIVVVDSMRYGDPANLGASPGVELVKHEIGFDPPARLAQALGGADYLFHLAAEKHNQSKDSPERVIASNVTGTLQLFEHACAAGVKKIVFTSSLYAYGRLRGEPFDESERCEPRTIYGISKLAGEHLLAHLHERHGTRYTILRYLFIYGPKQFAGMGYKSVIVKSFERLLAGEPPVVYGDGRQQLDYVFVDDAVGATLRALGAEADSELLNVGSGVGTSVEELVKLMVRVSGRQLAPIAGPADWTAGSCRVASVAKTARVLGWRASTPLAEGLARTLEWIRAARAAG